MRLVAGALVLAAIGVCAFAWRPMAPTSLRANTDSSSSATAATAIETSRQPLAQDESLWKRPLRRPIFDPPPPPPPPQVKVELPPIRAKLLGTILEPGNSQAMISLPGGSVEFRTVGQSLGPEDGEATIVEISSAAVKVQRGEEFTTLSVETIRR